MCKILSLKSHSGNEGARTGDTQTDEGILEMRVQKMSSENIFFRKLIVDIYALFELNLEVICSVCSN